MVIIKEKEGKRGEERGMEEEGRRMRTRIIFPE
jgi:hypothetical protein